MKSLRNEHDPGAPRQLADTVQITMPQMGESVSEGTVLTWLQAGRRLGRQGRDDRRGLDRQGRRRGTLAGRRQAREDPRPGGRDRRGRPAPGRDGARGRSGRPTAQPSDGAPRVRRPRRSDAASHAGGRRAVGRHDRRAGRGRRRAQHAVARRVAAAHGIDLEQVSGTGTGGRIIKDDVLGYVDRNGGDGAAAATAVPPRGRRGRAAADPRRRRGARPLHGARASRCRRRPASARSRSRRSTRRRRQLNDALKAAAARHEGVLHAPDRLRDRAGLEGPPDDGPLLPRGRTASRSGSCPRTSTSGSRSTCSARTARAR